MSEQPGVRSLRALTLPSRGQGSGARVLPSHDPRRALDFLHAVLERRMQGAKLDRYDGFAVASALGILAHERWRIEREDKLNPPLKAVDATRLTAAELDAAIGQAERELGEVGARR
jgi:hypothetical protein